MGKQRRIEMIEEAQKDYDKSDGTVKKWVRAALKRLKEKGSDIGKPLGNTNYAKLAGFKELKNNKLGIRMIYKVSDNGKIEIIIIYAIGKREGEKVFKTVEKRREK